jgi:hypothetical protein
VQEMEVKKEQAEKERIQKRRENSMIEISNHQ